jgi:hypothetical protein
MRTRHDLLRAVAKAINGNAPGAAAFDTLPEDRQDVLYNQAQAALEAVANWLIEYGAMGRDGAAADLA